MRGVRREHGTAKRQAAALLREDLFAVLVAMGDRMKDVRDRASLLIGFAGGLRRSELAAIDVFDFERVSVSRLSGEAVSLILRDRMATAGFDPTGYSGHSLRAGFSTSATRAGVSTFKIRLQTGHASDAMLSRYVGMGNSSSGTPPARYCSCWTCAVPAP